MMLRNAARIIALLSVTTAMAQSAPPAQTAPEGPVALGQGLAGRRVASLGARRTSSVQSDNSLRQRMEDLENTLNQMHSVLKQMHSRAAKSSVQDSVAKTNLEMWELMVGHLDKELQELRVAEAAREDREVRRAALYKQADQKVEPQAQVARAAQAAKFGSGALTPPLAAQGGGQSLAAETAPEQPPTPPANNPSSPN